MTDNKNSVCCLSSVIRHLLSFLCFAVYFICGHTAQAAPLVADLSNYQIHMDAGFNGTRIFVFGTRSDSGDVVVVVRGENKNYLVRKKEEVAGMWVNSDRMKFLDAPNFYALASSKPLNEIDQSALFTKLGIGVNYLLPAPPDISKIAKFNEFSQAFLDYQARQKLYAVSSDPISFMGETLFKTVIEFPDNIPAGNYTAEIYLLSDGEVVGMQSTPITVVKSGLDAYIYNFAHNAPVLYGITSIIMALVIGWFVGRLFEHKV